MKEPKKNKKQKGRESFLKDLEKKLQQKKNSSQNKSNKDSQKPQEKPIKPKFSTFRFLFLAFLSFIILSVVLMYFSEEQTKGKFAPYSTFIEKVKRKEINSCKIINENIIEFYYNDIKWQTSIPYRHNTLLPFLLENKVDVQSEKREENKYFIVLLQWLPWIILILFFWFFLSRQLKNQTGGALGFGKSKAKFIISEEIKETFNDVQGCEEAKNDLKDIVSFLKNPSKYSAIGARIPKGLLLIGPPGTGKTLLAKAVAGESKVPFLSMSGSDFVELFVGVGASRVRDLFETGKKNAPCIIFIDELDAAGRARGAGYGGGHDEREQTLNQMLVEMDGFGTDKGIIVLGATNRPDILDKALLRPGRFDRQIVVDIPDLKGRKAILEIHAKKIKLNIKVNLKDIARGTPGFTGADLANLINESALMAVNENKKSVSLDHIERAKDKLTLGTEKKSMLISSQEKKNTAYHEAGHALVGLLVKESPSLHKVSIIPRGSALGITYFLPKDGVLTQTKTSVEAELRVLYGGRVAEEVVFKSITNGAMNDIQRVTKIAHAMVCNWGFSELGPISFGNNEQPVFIGREIKRSETYSSETSKKIDTEIKRILDEAYKDTVKIIKENLSKLKKLAEKLLEKETLEVSEIYKLLDIPNPEKKSMI